MKKKDIKNIFDSLLEISQNVVYYSDASNKVIIDISDSVENLTGYTRNEVIGWSEEGLEKIAHPQDRDMLRLLRKEIDSADSGIIRESEMRIRHKNGDIILIRVKLTKIKSADGEAFIVGNIMNVSEQEQRDILLKELFENAFNAFIIISADINDKQEIVDFKFKMINPFAEKVLRMAEAELAGQSLVNVFPGVVKDKIFEKLVKVSLTGDPLNTEIYYNHEQFHNQWFQVSIVRIEDHHLLIGFEDITSKKYAEKEFLSSYNDLEKDKAVLSLKTINLEEVITARNKELYVANAKLKAVNDVLENFVYIAAHDLKSPIWTIKTSLDLMDETSDNEKKLIYRGYIEADLNKASRTIDGLMEMVKIQADQKNVEIIDIKSMIMEVLNSLEQPLALENIKIDLAVTEITYIKPYLITIFKNLLSNAVKYADDKRELQLTISNKRIDHFVEFEIQDNGIGIDLEAHGSRLFQPFERFTEKETGTGLGLFIIKNIIEKNGGFIKVKSTVNKGTIFYCSLHEYEY